MALAAQQGAHHAARGSVPTSDAIGSRAHLSDIGDEEFHGDRLARQGLLRQDHSCHYLNAVICVQACALTLTPWVALHFAEAV